MKPVLKQNNDVATEAGADTMEVGMKKHRMTRNWMRTPFVLVAGLTLGLTACSDSPTEVTDLSIPAQILTESARLAVSSIGDTVSVSARVLDQAGREVPGAQVTWRYEGDPILAPVVGAVGRYRSIAVGTGELIAEVSRGASGTIEARVPVAVMQVPAGLAIVARNTLWSIGAQDGLEARVVDARGNTIEPIRHQVSWSSADAAVARVDQTGKVTAVSDGATVISVSFGGLTGARTVRVSSTFGLSVCYTFDGAEDNACSTATFRVRERPVEEAP
jgi:hypothetical protein